MKRRKAKVLVREGGRGCRVCLIQRPDSPHFWLRWWDPSRRAGRGDYAWRSLGHNDLTQGHGEAKQLSALLFASAGGSDDGAPAAVTVAELFGLYLREKTTHKKPRTREQDLRWADGWQAFLGPERRALSIDENVVAGWRRMRGVSTTTLRHEIIWLRGVLRWATRKRRSDGTALLPFCPLEGVPLPPLARPPLPVASWGAWLAVYRNADRVDPSGVLRCLLALAWWQGWRISALCGLWASDVNRSAAPYWPHGRLRKRRATDKTAREAWVPLHPHARAELDRYLRRNPAIGDTPLFPAPRAAGWMQRQHALDLLHRAETRAGAEVGGFHAIRRAWATARKHLPLVDVAAAGDWAPATLYSHYQQADPETTLRVVAGSP